MVNLITQQDINTLARPCYTDEGLTRRCIAEAQDIDLTPAIGYALLSLASTERSERITQLFDGATWEDCNGIHRHKGIKTALAYYAWARATRASVVTATRFGAVVKQDDYSRTSSAQERQAAYGEAFAIADHYLAEVVEFLNANRDIYPEYCGGRVTNTRNKVKVIGL